MTLWFVVNLYCTGSLQLKARKRKNKRYQSQRKCLHENKNFQKLTGFQGTKNQSDGWKQSNILGDVSKDKQVWILCKRKQE